MASHPLNYDPYPEVQPTGGPEVREQIHTDADMFGGAIGRGMSQLGQGMSQLGQGMEHAGTEGLDVATQQARMDAQTHANELHSWQSDQVTNAQEQFLTLKGKDAELALPGFKAQIDQIHQDARSQAGNPYTANLVDTEGRRLTDAAYAQSARHAAQQKSVWDTQTATDATASAGSRAALGAQTTPGDVPINANPSVVLGLTRSDDFARQGAQLKGLDGDIEVQRNRGKNVAEIIKAVTADGSQISLQRAIDFFHTQYDRIDPGSRATIEQAIKGQAASYDGQKTADIYMGRGANLPPGYINRTFQIESGGDPNAQSGSHAGLGQFSPALEARYGINESNRTDPAVQARALSQENAENHDALARALGHEPTPADYYLAHQQGVGGAVSHLSQPNLPAWQNMASTIEGREKGAGWAKQAIWGNMTPDMKAQFPGGVETVTSGDFARMWAQRFYNQPIQASGVLPGNGTQAFGTPRLSPQAYFDRNQEFVKPGSTQFSTPLNPQDETAFRQWITTNKVPFDPTASGPQDYDMRGFWKGLQTGDAHAKSAIDPNDGKLHYPDYWKTPYHETFSNESKWANERAPHWTDDDKLVTPDGRVLFDDRKPVFRPMQQSATGIQQAAFGPIDRLGMAQDFSETNKGDVIKRITNDPYLLDHPLAMNAAITYTNKIFEAQTASYADMHRALQIQEAQKKMASEAAENDYLKQIYAPPANAKPISVQNVVLDDRLSRESKDRIIKLIGDPGEKDDKTYGSGFVKAFQMVHAPDGTPGRITDPKQLYDRLGANGDLTMAGVEKLRGEINLKQTPEGSAEGEMKKEFLRNARGQITGSDEGLHIKDPKGDELYLKFMAQVLPAYEAGRRDGKSPSQLLDPDSADYVGKAIKNFKRPMDQWFSDTVHDPAGTTAAKPVFDPASVKNLGDLVTAFRAGNVTKDQADQMAIERGWATRKPRAPVSQ